MARKTAINPYVNTVRISEASAKQLKDYLLQCKTLGYQNWNIRERMRKIDLEYAREVDQTTENQKAKVALAYGNANKYRNITVPVVLPQVEAAVTYQASVFLTGVPLFGVVAPPNIMGPAKQLETIIDNNATKGGWVDELTMFFRDSEKYNFGITEVEWAREMMPGYDTDISSTNNAAKIAPVAWEGNVLNRWDPYNTFWDIRVGAAQVAKRGEFLGTSEMVSRVELKKLLISDPAILKHAIKPALESSTPAITVSGDTSILSFYIPQISQSATINPALLGEFNWMAWAGLEPTGNRINYKNIYMRTKLYARIIPSDFGISVPGENTPQIWKFIFINDDILVYAQPTSAIYDSFPVFMSQPNRDGLNYQTKSLAENGVDFQNVTSALTNSIIASRRRAISDRVLYDPSRVSEAQINSENPSAKIPVRPAAYGKPIGEAVYQFPYKDDQAQLMFSEIDIFTRMADKINGQNPARQGQFVKGNKTRSEYDSTMANANGRDQLKAMIYECQVFTPMKECLKNNILEKQTPATLYSRELQAPVLIDPVSLRKASLMFKVSDGLIPSEKLMSGDELKDTLNVFGTSPALAAGYNMAPMFSYLMKTRGVDLAPFEKSPQQLQYEQAMGAWQNAISQAMETLKISLKAVDPAQISNLISQFQQGMPAQPKPQDFGFDPSQAPISVNTDPSATVLSQTQQLLAPPTQQKAPANGQVN